MLVSSKADIHKNSLKDIFFVVLRQRLFAYSIAKYAMKDRASSKSKPFNLLHIHVNGSNLNLLTRGLITYSVEDPTLTL